MLNGINFGILTFALDPEPEFLINTSSFHSLVIFSRIRSKSDSEYSIRFLPIPVTIASNADSKNLPLKLSSIAFLNALSLNDLFNNSNNFLKCS